MNQKNNDFCFTIMPFGGWFDTYYNEIYSIAIKNAGLKSKRADDLYQHSSIVKDIWQYTKESKVILADLTNKNPNVLYELGLAHAIAKPTIIITENINDIPFDLQGLRIIEYDKNMHNWGEILKDKITQAIEQILESPIRAIPHAFLDALDFSKESKGIKKQTFARTLQDTSSIITIKIPSINKEFIWDYSEFETIQNLFDSLWFKLNAYTKIKAYTYGKTWEVENESRNLKIKKKSMINIGADNRTLQEASIYSGDILKIRLIK